MLMHMNGNKYWWCSSVVQHILGKCEMLANLALSPLPPQISASCRGTDLITQDSREAEAERGKLGLKLDFHNLLPGLENLLPTLQGRESVAPQGCDQGLRLL